MRMQRHIVLVGPMGSGKSHVGRLLAGQLETEFVDIDARIEADAGRRIPALFADEGEAGFRVRETRVLAEVLAGPPAVIATGGGAVLAATNRRVMREAATVVYLQVDAATQLARLQGDTRRPLLQCEDRAATLSALQAAREPLYSEVAHHRFDTSRRGPKATAIALADLLSTPEDSRA